MRAVAAKSSANDTAARNSQEKNHKQNPVKRSFGAFSGSITLIQRKALCPCDGGCPRCSGVIQPKLTIGQPNDKYEQEADRVADQVMRMPEPKQSLVNGHSSLLQRKAGCSGCMDEEEEEVIHTKPIADQITPIVQRQSESEIEEEEEEPVQLKSLTGKSHSMTAGLQSQIQSMRGGGQPLPESTRAFFEPRFGLDFSQVRVHTGSKAAEAARSVNARAFTLGKSVFFGADQYSPGTSSGKQLLAHELVHTIQQSTVNSTFGHGKYRQRVNNKIHNVISTSPSNDESEPCSRTYIVREGDTVTRIASRNSVEVQDLINANPRIQSNPDFIRIGDELTIPCRPTSAPVPGTAPGASVGTGGAIIYTVRERDTLWSISSHFDVSIDAIMEANPIIEDRDDIRVGQELRIPGIQSRDEALPPTSNAIKVLDVANNELDRNVVEDPVCSNRGPRIDEYTNISGPAPVHDWIEIEGRWERIQDGDGTCGVAWCLHFIIWCMEQAGVDIKNLSSWALSVMRDSRYISFESDTSLVPLPGDIFLKRSRGGDSNHRCDNTSHECIMEGGSGYHAGFVLSHTLGSGYITTIEGNSHIEGLPRNRENDGVTSKTRQISDLSGVLRIT